MADDRMRNDDRDKNMSGGAGQKDNYGQQTPGRKQQDDMSTGQRGTGQQHQPGHSKEDLGSQKTGTGQSGRGQNR